LPSAVPTQGDEYTVQGGDTLSSIAQRFETSVVQLQDWNTDRYPSLASDPNLIQSGWVLLVRGVPSSATPRPSVAPSTPSPTTAACRANRPRSNNSRQVLAAIPGAGSRVALTFDMGGRLEGGADILNFLIANEVCATIFPTGAMAQTAEGRRIMAIVASHPEILEIGNHTMHHCDLVRGGLGSPTTAPCQTGGAPTADFIIKQLADAEAILRQLTGLEPRPFWRPPYGSYNQGVLDAAAAAGYSQTLMWDIDTIDWKPQSEGGPSAAQMAAKVINNASSGSNVLMHLGGYNTLEALRIMVPGLRDRGFTLSSLSEMMQ
jgi:peptidoglycan/xylan/chitin deacetylase (PgdA/CDA1 family)